MTLIIIFRSANAVKMDRLMGRGSLYDTMGHLSLWDVETRSINLHMLLVIEIGDVGE